MSAPAFSPRFLKLLLNGCGLKPGGRVLDVGCGDGAVVEAVCKLGFECDGIDDDAAAVARGRKARPSASIQESYLVGTLPYEQAVYDVAFLRGLVAYDGDLDGMEACVSTANVLCGLKPGGRVIVLFDDALTKPGTKTNDSQEALAEHLEPYPGVTKVEEFAEGVGRYLSPAVWLGRRGREGHRVVVHQTPSTEVTRLQWHAAARQASMGTQQAAA